MQRGADLAGRANATARSREGALPSSRAGPAAQRTSGSEAQRPIDWEGASVQSRTQLSTSIGAKRVRPSMKSRAWPSSWKSASMSLGASSAGPPSSGRGTKSTIAVWRRADDPSSPTPPIVRASHIPATPGILPARAYASRRIVPIGSPVTLSEQSNRRTSSCQPKAPSTSTTRTPNTPSTVRASPARTASSGKNARRASPSAPSSSRSRARPRGTSQSSMTSSAAGMPSSVASGVRIRSSWASRAARNGGSSSSRKAVTFARPPPTPFAARASAHDVAPTQLRHPAVGGGELDDDLAVRRLAMSSQRRWMASRTPRSATRSRTVWRSSIGTTTVSPSAPAGRPSSVAAGRPGQAPALDRDRRHVPALVLHEPRLELEDARLERLELGPRRGIEMGAGLAHGRDPAVANRRRLRIEGGRVERLEGSEDPFVADERCPPCLDPLAGLVGGRPDPGIRMDDRKESALAVGRPHRPQRIADVLEEAWLARRAVALRVAREGAGERRVGRGQPAVGGGAHVVG